MPGYENYRREASSPPALSPPSSTTSGPTTSSSNPYQTYQQPQPLGLATGYPPVDPTAFASMAVTPSPPPPSMGYGIASAAGGMGGGFASGAMGQFTTNPLGTIQPPMRNGMNGMGGMNGVNGMNSMGNLGGGGGGIPVNEMNGWSARNGYPSGMPPLDDDVIPTAIVIKNIPFAVPREQLLGVIESLGAPLPYAFNYHHDNGIFRGLAFANFRAPEEAASVVAALNGYDVQGRKLRVEYKKVLQPGEKDKIEREKALKRMRSIQFDHSPAPGSSGMGMGMGGSSRDMPPPLSIPGNGMGAVGSNRFGGSNGRASAEIDHSPPHSATSSGNSGDLPLSLDLNDPTALDIYSRVLVFKEDRMRDELAFSRTLTPMERRIVHLVAQKLGLISTTRGEGEMKFVVVTRDSIRQSGTSTSTSSAYLSPYTSNSDSLSPSLRIKKSMPDLRGFNGPVVARDPARSLTPQRSSGNLRGDSSSREYVSMGAAGGRRMNGTGSGNFNSFFGSSADSIPPVPPLPAGLGLSNQASQQSNLSSQSIEGIRSAHASPNPAGPYHHVSHHSMSQVSQHSMPSSSPDSFDHSAAPLRNPRGPAATGRGFGVRPGGTPVSGAGVVGGGAGAGGSTASVGSVGSVGSGAGGGGILRGNGGNGPIGSISRSLGEGDDGEVGNDTAEMARTRESLDL